MGKNLLALASITINAPTGKVWNALINPAAIKQYNPEKLLQYSHFSPLSGLPDLPENVHLVTVELSPEGNQTRVTLTQDKNESEEEKKHSEENWGMMLGAMKKYIEG